jgi:hypothetical protein
MHQNPQGKKLMATKTKVYLFRVVIVNSQGQRLLDTLVKIEEEMMVIVKPGKKSNMLYLGN